MNDLLFNSIIKNGNITLATFAAATIASLIIGSLIAITYVKRNNTTSSMALTLLLLPAIVQIVIMMVNGNIGAGVAVAGAFSLVRFRSVAGKGLDITAIFLSMAAGLATGMGYIGIAILFTVIILLVYCAAGALFIKSEEKTKILQISIPENINDENAINDTLKEYVEKKEMLSFKTANMGSIYKITYEKNGRRYQSKKWKSRSKMSAV